jgi:mannose-6-phosphate isomerase-like protein (cupin superfamily)
MRRKLLVTVLIASFSGLLFAQTPLPQPGQPAVRQARPAATPPTVTVTVQVTDAAGLVLANVRVTGEGPVSRDGVTSDDGSVRFSNMRAGSYRLRFVREGSITLERDITVRIGEPLLVDVSLSAAPVPKAPPPPPPIAPPAPAPKPLGPPVEPKVTPIPAFLDKNLITGREPQKSSPLGCTSTATGTLNQLREAWVNRSHEAADEWLYVVAGEATLRLPGSEQHLQAGTFSLIPHTVVYSLLPSGRNPLIVVSILSGPPCAQ